MYDIIQGIKEKAQSAILAGAVSLLSAVGCNFDDSKKPAAECASQTSYNLEVVVADYNTGQPIEGAIVRARWGDQSEGIICPVSREADAGTDVDAGSVEAGKYICSGIPSDTSLEITVGSQTEIYANPIVDFCEANQDKTYLFGANGSEDAGSDTLDAGHDHGHDLDAGYDRGHDLVTDQVEDARVDASDAQDTVSDVAADIRTDAADLRDLVLDTPEVSDDYDIAELSDLADTVEIGPDAETGSDAYTILENLSQIPDYRSVAQVLVPTPFLEVQARELGFLNVAQYDVTAPLVAPSTGLALMVYNACFAPEFAVANSGFTGGDCTQTPVIQENKTIVNLSEGRLVTMEVGGINEAAAALTLAAAGNLEGLCQIVDGIDPETAAISDCPEE